jgi:V/A-type H+/Na+-transporting ATPase subunit F
MKLAGLCDKDTATGLRLAGVKELFIADKNELSLWNNIKEKDDIGILFITEEIVKTLGNHLKDYRLINNIPIVIEIPDKKGRKKDHIDFVSHLIKKAVGIEIDKEKIK